DSSDFARIAGEIPGSAPAIRAFSCVSDAGVDADADADTDADADAAGRTGPITALVTAVSTNSSRAITPSTPPICQATGMPRPSPIHTRTISATWSTVIGTQNAGRYGSGRCSTAGRIVVACAMIIENVYPRNTEWITAS